MRQNGEILDWLKGTQIAEAQPQVLSSSNNPSGDRPSCQSSTAPTQRKRSLPLSPPVSTTVPRKRFRLTATSITPDGDPQGTDDELPAIDTDNNSTGLDLDATPRARRDQYASPRARPTNETSFSGQSKRRRSKSATTSSTGTGLSPRKKLAQIAVGQHAIESHPLSLASPHLNRLPSSLRTLMLELEDVSMGTRPVVSRRIRPDFGLFSSPSHAQYDPAVRPIPDSFFAPPEERDSVGPTPSLTDVLGILHEANRAYDKMLDEAEYHHVNSTTTNKVDFVLIIEPSADPNPRHAAAAVSQIDQLRSQSPCLSINHTAFEPLLRCPIAVCMETKRPGAGDEVATVQAGIWAAAQWSLLESLTTIEGNCQLPGHIYLPAIVVVGHDWSLAATTRSGTETVNTTRPSYSLPHVLAAD
ncbi:hypothetical protein DHEL01_v212638 [Diaporthe helianthi]|uniref:PD-(D/E)XK nuclease-like domain-containing protein n=1 Tax=Diaporthe helianthi TaxID=158607 RepID=A0A2P5HFD8_DIAHE|nr:hypothetical protein DHEL01_v212638 [Diaporthe helianthi]